MSEFIFDVATQLTAVLLAIAGGWFILPFGWPFKNRKLRWVIGGRKFRMTYDPTTSASKHVTFLFDGRFCGRVGEGQNKQEHRWRIQHGKLEILDKNGEIYSRFRFDAPSGQLVHTNEPDTKSKRGQFFEVQWEPARHPDTNHDP